MYIFLFVKKKMRLSNGSEETICSSLERVDMEVFSFLTSIDYFMTSKLTVDVYINHNTYYGQTFSHF